MSDINKSSYSFKELFEAMVNNCNEIIIITDTSGLITFVNSIFEQVIGLPGEQLLGKELPPIIHEDDIEICRSVWQSSAVEFQAVTDFEFRVYTKDKQVKWLSLKALPLVINSTTVGMQHSLIDITAQKQVEIELFESRRFSDELLNASPNCVYVHDIIEKSNIYNNDGFMSLLGYSQQDIREMGDNLVAALMDPIDYDDFLQTIVPVYQAAEDRQVIEYTYRMRHRDQTWHWISFSEVIFNRLEDGTPSQVLGIMIDITKQYRFQEELQESEFHLKQSQKVSSMGHLIYDIHEDLWVSSEGLDQILGIDESVEHTFSGFANLVHEEDAPEFVKYIEQKVLTGIEPFDREFRMKPNGNGDVRWMHGLGTFETDSSGEPARIFCTIQDITERKQMKIQLLQAEKMQAIGELAGGMAHDFNNQLAVILGFAQLLKVSNYSTEDDMENIQGIIQAVENASNLTRQLLAYARKGKYQAVDINLHTLLDEVSNILQHTIDKRISITTSYDVKYPVITGDYSQIQNVVMNLALNARRCDGKSW
jgi:PAS domain S-box-containing protein